MASIVRDRPSPRKDSSHCIKVRCPHKPSQTLSHSRCAALGMLLLIARTLVCSPVSLFVSGMGSPLFSAPLLNAVVFAAYGVAKSGLHALQATPHPLTLGELSAAGAFAGLANSIIVCPVELIKTRLQLQHEHASLLHAHGTVSRADPSRFAGPMDCIAKTVRAQGVAGLFRGMTATILREVPCYAGQFWCYETLKRCMMTGAVGQSVEDLPAAKLLLAGGTAGIFCWVVSYPQDFVKSQLQAEPYLQKSAFQKHPFLFDGGFISCWRSVVVSSKGGFGALWKGFPTCAARAFPANAAGFFAYETALEWMRGKREK